MIAARCVQRRHSQAARTACRLPPPLLVAAGGEVQRDGCRPCQWRQPAAAVRTVQWRRGAAHDAEALVCSAVRRPDDQGGEGGGARLHVQTQRGAVHADAAVGADAPALGGAAAGRHEDHAAALPKLLCVCEGARVFMCEGGGRGTLQSSTSCVVASTMAPSGRMEKSCPMRDGDGCSEMTRPCGSELSTKRPHSVCMKKSGGVPALACTLADARLGLTERDCAAAPELPLALNWTDDACSCFAFFECELRESRQFSPLWGGAAGLLPRVWQK